METRLPFKGTPAEPFLWESALATEQRVAELRVIAAIFTFTYAAFKFLGGTQIYLTPPWFHAGTVIFFLTYTVVYRLWRPYRRHNLTWSARVVVFMDYCVALVLIINNGGLLSPYWALLALVAMEYTLRFGYTAVELAIGAVVFFGAVTLTNRLDPAPLQIFLNVALGVGMILFLIIQLGLILINREREAIRATFEAELDAITRMVNTIQHEVNNPLTAAKSYLMLIRREGLPEPFSSHGDRVDEALDRIASVVNRLQQLREKRLIHGIGNLDIYTFPEAVKEGN